MGLAEVPEEEPRAKKKPVDPSFAAMVAMKGVVEAMPGMAMHSPGCGEQIDLGLKEHWCVIAECGKPAMCLSLCLQRHAILMSTTLTRLFLLPPGKGESKMCRQLCTLVLEYLALKE